MVDSPTHSREGASQTDDIIISALPNPTTSAPNHEPQPTNSSPIALKLISSIFAFFTAGVNDGSLGALIPYILLHHHIGPGSIAITYATAFAGWVLAALLGTFVRIYLGGGGSLILGAGMQVIGQALRVWDPPFALFCITFFFIALGQAFQDSQANTFVSTVKVAHRWLGVIHASYAAGCLVGPLIATSIAVSNPEKWTLFYWAPLGMGILNIVLVSIAFQKDVKIKPWRKSGHESQEVEMGVVPREGEAEHSTGKGGEGLEEIMVTIKEKNVWRLSLFFFFYLGTAITAGGWLVEYLVTVRHSKLSTAGYIPTAYYGGSALGRLLLAEPTHRFGEKKMLLIYTILCLVLQIIFWRVNNLVADSTVITLMGLLLGPYFAAGISVGTRILPSRIRASALSLVFVVALAGGSIFPALAGVVAQKAGVSTLQPILVGLLIALGISWAFVPKVENDKQE